MENSRLLPHQEPADTVSCHKLHDETELAPYVSTFGIERAILLSLLDQYFTNKVQGTRCLTVRILTTTLFAAIVVQHIDIAYPCLTHDDHHYTGTWSKAFKATILTTTEATAEL